MITIKNLAYCYGKQKVYDNFNLHVPENQVCLITGINGVGKSTLLRLIAGVLKPKKGSITYNEKLGPDPRKNIGFISDKLSLYKDLQVKEAIDLHCSVFGIETFNDSLLNHIKIDPKKKVKDLSVGQQTFLHLSLILANKPRLLLMDEVIPAMDAYLKKIFLTELLSLIAEHQMTLILVNLNFHDIEHLVDRVILLKDGQIAVDEPIDDLKQKVRKVVASKEPCGIPIISKHEYPDTGDYFIYPFEENVRDQIDGEILDLDLTEIVSAFIGGEYA